MLKILQTRLQQYVNHELPDVQAGIRKGKGNRSLKKLNLKKLLTSRESRRGKYAKQENSRVKDLKCCREKPTISVFSIQ